MNRNRLLAVLHWNNQRKLGGYEKLRGLDKYRVNELKDIYMKAEYHQEKLRRGRQTPPPIDYEIVLLNYIDDMKQSKTGRKWLAEYNLLLKSKKGNCKDYKVVDLKVFAKDNNIKGRSAKNKEELCKALGIPYTPSPKKMIKHKQHDKCKDYKVVDLRKQAVEKGIVGRSNMNKEKLCQELGIIPKGNTHKYSPSKNCDKYKVIDLKKMASERGIKGRSTMRKHELCNALKI